ncbi:MAG: ketoacyl-ACP synthase III [Treponema sp.]|jgi:3-oxoacyl-[acyl-carrier-protein] synthase-3|nr:ketoacyl-ACP synthase III [Treponema sp.]
MAFEITGTGRAVPSRRVTNDELAAEMNLDTSDEWIRSHTGIGARHIAASDIAASDLGLEAARKALAMASGIDADDETAMAEAALSVDVIILATASPDFFSVPSTACLVQDRIGAKNASAMDIVAGCTGFVYGLETAAGLLAMDSGRKRALVIGSEVLSRVTDWSDRGTCVLFGDGAGAVVLDKTDAAQEGEARRGILKSILKADGSGAEHLVCRRGGSRNPYKTGEVIDAPPHIAMNGQAVYNFAVKAITDTVAEILAKSGIPSTDIAWIVPHQANSRIIQAAARRLKIPEEKFYLNIENYANTSAASIPIALDELNREGKLKRGDLVIFMGFGAGLTYGANLVVW